jgi:hypothetical protein
MVGPSSPQLTCSPAYILTVHRALLVICLEGVAASSSDGRPQRTRSSVCILTAHRALLAISLEGVASSSSGPVGPSSPVVGCVQTAHRALLAVCLEGVAPSSRDPVGHHSSTDLSCTPLLVSPPLLFSRLLTSLAPPPSLADQVGNVLCRRPASPLVSSALFSSLLVSSTDLPASFLQQRITSSRRLTPAALLLSRRVTSPALLLLW